MTQVQPMAIEKVRHPFRRCLPMPDSLVEQQPRLMQEDVSFFLVSFASAFIILYGFIL
jgi:hypothetical protein